MCGSLLGVFGGAVAAQEYPYEPLPSPVSATCPGGLCQPEGLRSFFAALDRGGPVAIVQFGDSHTAGGHITRSLLWRVQTRFERATVSLSAHGVVGATLNNLAQRMPLLSPDDGAPDLVVIAFGTNEGFDDRLDLRAYEVLLQGQIRRVREAVPGASILILGAPEAMRGDGGGRCAGDVERRWKAPEMLSLVRDVQHRVAVAENVAFWDWQGRMGGDCSAHALTLVGPGGETPLMRGDHVHFTGEGGDWIGSLLFADIAAAHDRRGDR